jgi:hypothetical protein
MQPRAADCRPMVHVNLQLGRMGVFISVLRTRFET